PHRRAVSPAVVRTDLLVVHPVIEIAAVAAVRVALRIAAYRGAVGLLAQDGVRHRDGEHGIVGERATWAEELELRRLRRKALEARADDVAGDRPDHVCRRLTRCRPEGSRRRAFCEPA